MFQDAIDETEHATLVRECTEALKRRRYEDGHWDGVIHKFREVTKRTWSGPAMNALKRIKGMSRVITESDAQFLPPHVLDLAENGFIKPHVDSLIASGEIVAGLSLLSPSIMRLTPKKDSEKGTADRRSAYPDVVLLQLRPRSFYVLSGKARYEYAHEILPGPVVWRGGEVSERERRISIILRDALPPP